MCIELAVSEIGTNIIEYSGDGAPVRLRPKSGGPSIVAADYVEGSIAPLDLRIGAVWLIPWFAAMVLVSWLCDPSSHPELFNWVFLINGFVAVAIYLLAMRFRLPTSATQARIREAEEEANVGADS